MQAGRLRRRGQAAGEQCDAGVNNSNTGACKLNRTLPSCGDGFVQPSNGEQCDDGDQSNNNACLNSCQAAAWGDGFVYQGVEQCDDANQSNNDGCTNMCKPPTCGDGFKNGGESDVDWWRELPEARAERELYGERGLRDGGVVCG
ncbi:MAG: DUF4215 domain-containing protein [Nannocystis sp.]|nr:DUF4215 domain-containing protein [Nannocystis sp.]